MVYNEYTNAYSEVIEILKYVPRIDYEKIPKDKLNFFEKNANKEYNVRYNPDFTLDENNISKRAKAIIAIIFRDYWATDIQKETIKNLQKLDRIKLEEEKKEKYNAQTLFANKTHEDEKEEIIQSCTELTNYKKSWIKTIITKIKCLFHK